MNAQYRSILFAVLRKLIVGMNAQYRFVLIVVLRR